MHQNESRNFDYCYLSPPFVATVYITLSIFGLIGYSLFLATVLKNRNHFFKNTFWILAIYLSFPDCLFLLITIFYEVPCVITGDQIYGSTIGSTFSNLSSLLFFTIMTMMVFMSVDRLIKVVIQGYLALQFSKTFIVHCLTAISWIWAMILVIIMNVSGCKFRYLQKQYGYDLSCLGDNRTFIFMGCVTYLNFGILVFSYTLIFAYIKCKKLEVQIEPSKVLIIICLEKNLF